MGFIIKNTAGLINTRLTDIGREKLSQGNFNISYFQIGDSEVSYNTLPTSYNQFDTVILEPSFNAQNSSGVPQSNKSNVKYPYYVDGVTGNTYGIPFMDSQVSPVYNRAVMRGFFTGNTSADTISWSALTNNSYAINANYVVQMSSLDGTDTITLISNPSNPDSVREPAVGDIITIYYDGSGLTNCYCVNLATPTPTPSPTSSSTTGTTPTPTPTPTSSSGSLSPCESPTPTPTPSKTPCLTPSTSRVCPLPPSPDCLVDMTSCYSILTYKIVNICLGVITLDRPTPNFTNLITDCYARVIVYPPNMTTIYDSYTPSRHWNDNVINFESVNYTDEFDVKIWNMNIPWSENPAGLISSISKDYTNFGSVAYLGAKEYFGYTSSSGQIDSSSTYYNNSFGDKINVKPEEQKAVGIIHYTNQTVDFFYGEKFALQPFDPSNPADTTGEARNFKVHIPWLMWHKNPNCCNGQTFWVDPPGFEDLDLFQVQYLQSTKNIDMNNPGMRYYHLWDTNANIDGIPNRIGKVFPDDKLVVIDDEEIIAAMSYKSNRNWTLPSPKISLITPNTCGNDNSTVTGILTGTSEYLYVTYRLSNTELFTDSLHCNYYSLIQGPNIDCNPVTSQNVSVRFGGEFGCLNQPQTGTTILYDICLDLDTQQFHFIPNGEDSGGIQRWISDTVLGVPDTSCQIIWNSSSSEWVMSGWSAGYEFVSSSPYPPLSGWSVVDEPTFIVTANEGACSSVVLYDICISTDFAKQGSFIPNGVDQWISSSPGFSGSQITWDSLTSKWEMTDTSGNIYESLTTSSPPLSGWYVVGVPSLSVIANSGACTPFIYYQFCMTIEDGIAPRPYQIYFNNNGSDANGNQKWISVTVNDIPDINYQVLFDEMTGLWKTVFLTYPLVSSSPYPPFSGWSALGYTGVTVTVNEGSCTPLLMPMIETSMPMTESLIPPFSCPCDSSQGFFANKFEILCQKVVGNARPNSSEWVAIDFTSQLTSTMIDGYITQEGLTGNTFVITQQDYDEAPTYNLNTYIPLTPVGYTGTSLNFGDEYYFYGSLETDIQATIYEMNYKINLGQAEFQTTSNPTWTSSKPSYVSEVGLYDSNKNLMIISKMQSPVLRQGIQQFLIKFDI
jgi:hypothetical protein